MGVALPRLGQVAPHCKPDPVRFGQFVRALGKRYPTVKMWSIWNEPNLRPWLSPQYEVAGSQAWSGRRDLPLARASAIAGLRGTGHRADQILLGETAPLGDNLFGCSTQRSLRVPRGARPHPQDAAETFLRARVLPEREGPAR